MTVLFWIMVVLTVFWIFFFISQTMLWMTEEEDRVFPWILVPIVCFHVPITILLYLLIN